MMRELLASQKGLAAPLLHKRQFGLFQPYYTTFWRLRVSAKQLSNVLTISELVLLSNHDLLKPHTNCQKTR
jgi:hypothetical protein